MQEKLDVVVAQLEVGRSCVFGGVRLISLAKDYIGLALPVANATELGSLRDDLAVAVGAAKASGAVRIDARLKLVMPSPTEIVQSLKEWGFTKDADRVEFSCAVSELPSDEGTPFAWSNARELQWTKDDVVSFLSQVASGGLNPDVCDHAEFLVVDFLQNQELTCGMTCLHIASFEGKPAGLCVVQINPKNGWSRLSFMGLLPAYRGMAWDSGSTDTVLQL